MAMRFVLTFVLLLGAEVVKFLANVASPHPLPALKRRNASDRSMRRDYANSPYDHKEHPASHARPAFDVLDHAPRRWSRRPLPALPDGVAVVEYVIADGRLLIFCITRKEVVSRSIEVTSERLYEVVTRFESSIVTRQSTVHVAGDAFEAYEYLVSPVAALLRDAHTIIFVVDRFLQRVPFAALHDKTGFLIENHAIAVSTGTQLLESLAEQRGGKPARDVLVIADPVTARRLPRLPHGEREAHEVGAMYGQASVAVGSEATRGRFLREWHESSIVHFAGHASSIAEQASLLFAGRKSNDYIDGDELESSPATRLVVLAACETMPLTEAFLAAGVPTVVGTLWPIEDASSRTFFVGFHQSIAASATAGEALRHAQLDFLASADARLRHPASWAGMTVVGVPWLRVQG